MTVMAVVLWIFTILFLAFIVVDIGMFVSLGRQGDERRKMIVEKSSAQTFAVFAVYTLFCVLEGLYRSLFHGEAMEGKNPLVSLTVMALIYTVLLFRNKRKYGD